MLSKSQSPDAKGLRAIEEFRCKGEITGWDHSIFVYREPIDRLVSAFNNKFIVKHGHEDIFRNFEKRMEKSAAKATFEDFVEYTRRPFNSLDPHVWPQKAHLLDIEYTLVIKIENLTDVISNNFPSLACHFSQSYNSTKKVLSSDEDLTRVPADQLVPISISNVERLWADIEERYSCDVEMIREIE